ncbi:hypothetical protein BH10CHL1_BH10CHL1_19970 [soil metagenome]
MQKYLCLVSGLFMTMALLVACAGDAPTATPTAATSAPPTLVPVTLAPATTATTTLATAATLAPTTPTVPPQPTSQGDAAKGQPIFAASCSACHGLNAEGIKGLGKDMTTSQFIASKSDTELLEFIKQGRAVNDPLNTTGIPMPPKGGNPALTDDQLLDIIAYIRTLQK